MHLPKDGNHSPDPHGLVTREYFWVNHHDFLLARGYKLRPRYEPGWIGSWKLSGKYICDCEDSNTNWLWNILDATRLNDGVKVILKLVPTMTEQIPISLYLSSESLLLDPRNRTVRFSDVIPLPNNDEWALLVMPFLREFDDPPFRSLSECIEATRQILEGATFMHEHRVAHRDACDGNIMMDSTNLIPSGFHHAARGSPDGIVWLGSKLTNLTRSSVAPMEYFFIDFGLSSRFPDNDEKVLVTGSGGQNKKVPELSSTVPYDPFKVDIYQIGGIIKELIKTYHGLCVFRPLAAAMSRHDPSERPTAADALQQFETIVSKLRPADRRAPVILYKAWLPTKILRNLRRLFPLQED